MTSQDKPLCPYCGEHNGHPDGVEMADMEYWYRCPVCGCLTPLVTRKEDNLPTALRRFQPMQKPLTLDEVEDVCNDDPMYMEIATGADEIDGYWVRCPQYDETTVDFLHFGQRRLDRRNAGEYSKTWRCWRTRPTDEERAAAKWEENHEASTS